MDTAVVFEAVDVDGDRVSLVLAGAGGMVTIWPSPENPETALGVFLTREEVRRLGRACAEAFPLSEGESRSAARDRATAKLVEGFDG